MQRYKDLLWCAVDQPCCLTSDLGLSALQKQSSRVFHDIISPALDVAGKTTWLKIGNGYLWSGFISVFHTCGFIPQLLQMNQHNKWRTQPLFHWCCSTGFGSCEEGKKNKCFCGMLMLLITYKWSFLKIPCASLSVYICVGVYVSICLSINLPVHLHPCVWLQTDSHSSLPRGWVLLLLLPCNTDSGKFYQEILRDISEMQ